MFRSCGSQAATSSERRLRPLPECQKKTLVNAKLRGHLPELLLFKHADDQPATGPIRRAAELQASSDVYERGAASSLPLALSHRNQLVDFTMFSGGGSRNLASQTASISSTSSVDCCRRTRSHRFPCQSRRRAVSSRPRQSACPSRLWSTACSTLPAPESRQ
jgi:hypothetical protein